MKLSIKNVDNGYIVTLKTSAPKADYTTLLRRAQIATKIVKIFVSDINALNVILDKYLKWEDSNLTNQTITKDEVTK